ncbi:MAG TPA: helix-turn-helix domain-containing protein [Thermoanaerobaculia bacterium]|jgi:DNA-binding XRE family transcriptional regulator|nr:helix-turn-helix domain-containing protein [Thermoanaerobaculia bacterium]
MKKSSLKSCWRVCGRAGRSFAVSREPSRTFSFEEPDVRSLREKHGLSQPKFAALMGISVGTLRNWEQGGGNRRVARECCCG